MKVLVYGLSENTRGITRQWIVDTLEKNVNDLESVRVECDCYHVKKKGKWSEKAHLNNIEVYNVGSKSLQYSINLRAMTITKYNRRKEVYTKSLI